MGSNNSGKQVSFQKIVTGLRVSVSSQYKKKITLSARPDPTANKCDAGSLTIVANDTGPRIGVNVSRLTCVSND
jgi:hypothetical protein